MDGDGTGGRKCPKIPDARGVTRKVRGAFFSRTEQTCHRPDPHNTPMKRLAILLAALSLAACENPGSIDDYSFGVGLDFTSRPSTPPTPPVPQLTVTGGAGEILVEGKVTAPSPCQRLSGSSYGEGRTVAITVRIEPVGQACAAILGSFTYTARATGLAPGDYTLRVQHDYPGAEWDPPFQEFEVTVR